MSLAQYLQQYFVEKSEFAALAGLSVSRLEQLIDIKAIPSATYICDDDSVYSAIFGSTQIETLLTGEYFRPECVRWVHIAHQAPCGAERAAVITQLTKEFRAALASYGQSEQAVHAKIQSYLPYFFNGTFGLCVADPSCGASIIKKEMLQEKLIAITDNGNVSSPVGTSKDALLQLIDDYAASAMPFSPAEYERSSRKRLVDDLRSVVAAA
ncbi:DUF6058 family natural product biosynthesis protein [Thalassotalea sp. G2M2-11]|uniref:DUF6058 family natural product biosynthesis protein n=1 Tax=Thalassotalea sp. G2M2-11 TaxID=2787627 RepID=UPI0019D08FC0|nr:DUF6058 family natural product biosynthesis protein [Thalassotalea sp. G2M2-11]